MNMSKSEKVVEFPMPFVKWLFNLKQGWNDETNNNDYEQIH